MENKDRSVKDIALVRALARWENEGGRALPSAEQASIPEMTNAEIVALRVRVIALENVVISLLVTASDQQLALIRQMADYISPRPGHTHHPLTIHAAGHMVDLVERSIHFRSYDEGDSVESIGKQAKSAG
ncbi:MAG: hypothetical protein AB7S71_20525 [Dongiaceae bacterium]